MQNSALATISEPQASSNSLVVRKWIVTFGEIFGREITPELVKVWCKLLADVDAEALNHACERAAKTCKFFPSPAEIRGQLDRANAAGFALEAEEKWQQLLEWVKSFYHPNIGVKRGAPQLDPAIQFAARVAGGFHWLESCPESELQWAKKRFIESFSRVHETGEVEHLLTDGEARRILATLRAGLPQSINRQLAPAPEALRYCPSKSEVRAALDRAISLPVATAAMSDEEFEERKREQKRRLEEWEAARQKALIVGGPGPHLEQAVGCLRTGC